MTEPILNKVADSGLITLDLEQYYPREEIVLFDLKPLLFMEMILKEKEFRQALQQFDWQPFAGKIVAVTCSADAIIPVWAYMLLASYLQPIAKEVIMGEPDSVRKQIFLRNIQAINESAFIEQRVVIKGCGDIPIGDEAYMEITKKLRPVAKSIMYGEPCSTVPVFKKK